MSIRVGWCGAETSEISANFSCDEKQITLIAGPRNSSKNRLGLVRLSRFSFGWNRNGADPEPGLPIFCRELSQACQGRRNTESRQGLMQVK